MIRSAVLLTLAAMAMPVTAATNWTLTSSSNLTNVNGDCLKSLSEQFGNSCRVQGTYDANGTAKNPSGATVAVSKGQATWTASDNAMVSAWSTTNQADDGNEYWQDAQLMKYSGGFGVTNRDGVKNQGSTSPQDPNEVASNVPEHAIDNNDKVDGVLYTFTRNIALQSLMLGYRNTDADLAVFRFAGTGIPPQLSTTTAGGLISAGWEHVGNYADVGTSSTLCLAGKNADNSCKTSAAASSWWLVTAYNPTYAKGPANSALTAGNDYFKLLTVSGDIKVSEPAALALAGLGLFGVLATRRKRAAAAG